MSDGEPVADRSPSVAAARAVGVLVLTLLVLAACGWRLRAFVADTTDLGSYFVPKYQYAADRIAAGQLPQWNPFEFGGIPFLATIQPGVFYPPLRLAYAMFSGETAYRVLFVAQILAASLGTLLLARDLGLRAWPATLAAMWVTQPTLLVRIYDHPIYLTGVTWIPFLLLASRRLVHAPTPRRASLLGLLAALQAVSGYPPLVLATAYLLALALPFWLLESDVRRRAAHVSRVGAALAIAILVAVLVAAIQLLPLVELARLTNRTLETKAAHQRLEEIARLSPQMLFVIGIPQMTLQAGLAEMWRVFGSALLALGVAGVVLRRQRPATWFLVAATILTAGLPFPAYASLPLYGFVRFALEWAFMAPVAVYLLAAWGLDAVLERFKRLQRLGAPLTISVLVVATATNWQLLDRRWLTLDYGTPPPVPEMVRGCDVHDPLFRSYWPDGQLRGSLMAERVRSPAGYEQSLLPERSARLNKLLGVGNGGIVPRWAKAVGDQPTVASRMSVRCLITTLAPALDVGGWVNLNAAVRTQRHVYLNPTARPRIRLEHTVRLAASADAALELLRDGPLDGVILEDPDAANDAAAMPCADAGRDRVELLRDDPEHVRIATSSACPAFLVLTDTLLDGWTATLDGEPVPILHADFAFRAVRLPAGAHEVVFRYAAPGLRAGAVASLVGLVLAGALLMVRARGSDDVPERR